MAKTRRPRLPDQGKPALAAGNAEISQSLALGKRHPGRLLPSLRTTYGQLRGKANRVLVSKRHQIKRLEFLLPWFGTRRSKVQILSPRPFFYNQQVTLIQIVNERLVLGQ